MDLKKPFAASYSLKFRVSLGALFVPGMNFIGAW